MTSPRGLHRLKSAQLFQRRSNGTPAIRIKKIGAMR